MCVCVCVCVCVCELLAGGGVLTGQSRAFLLGGDVMRTSSPLADRRPCLCSPPEEKPHCVSVCVCVCVCVCLSLSVSVWLRYWLMGEVGKPRGTREGLLSPAAQGEGTTYWCLPLKHTQKEEVSHVLQSTVAAQPDCAALSDCPLRLNSVPREAEFSSV